MLSEYKEIYKNNAALLEGWEKMDRNDLCRKYVELKEKNATVPDCYISAIIYKFWNILVSQYYSQQIKIFNEEDCYDWIIESILYVLDKHVWTDPTNILYNDPKGPEKAVHVKSKHLKGNFLVYSNRQKRKSNMFTKDIDSPTFSESVSDDCLGVLTKTWLNTKVKEFFKKKLYLEAFSLDAILYDNLFSVDKNQNIVYFNIKQLKHHLRTLDERYCALMSETYEMNYDLIKNASDYLINVDGGKLEKKITKMLFLWSKDKEFIEYLGG